MRDFSVTGVLRVLMTTAALFLNSVARAANFSDVLPGARPMGMGMAYTAISDEPFGLFYNPAGAAGGDFTQLGAALGRMFSPVGPLSTFALAYTRPFTLRANSNVGAGFFNQRQNNAGDRDVFLMHYSEAFRLPELALVRPLKAGANLKILSVDAAKGVKQGLGLDVGALFDTNVGLKTGLSVTDLTTDVGLPTPSFNLGSAYTWQNWLTLASDLRVRRGLTQFFPGLEAGFYEGLLKFRMGKGLPLDGITQIAFGIGANFSPVFIDYAMTVPFNGMTRPGGAYQMTVTYKFGAPSFYGRFIGTAARQAEDLRSELSELESRRRTLRSQTEAAQANQEAAQERLQATENRLKLTQERMRGLEKLAEEKRYEIAAPKPKREVKPPPPPKPPPFPRRHKVAAGDTLRSIAAQHYGDPNLWELIYNANSDKIERGLPQEGSFLIIPSPTREPGP
ncbi:MAG: hypothetical protein HY551_01870 [Elusimicrobia bacterium]|nr:hypothetical protein [Elusimicrobiota bacterium]